MNPEIKAACERVVRNEEQGGTGIWFTSDAPAIARACLAQAEEIDGLTKSAEAWRMNAEEKRRHLVAANKGAQCNARIVVIQAAKLLQQAEALKAAEEVLSYVSSLGVVFVHPDDWDYRGMCGGPELENCDTADLAAGVADALSQIRALEVAP